VGEGANGHIFMRLGLQNVTNKMRSDFAGGSGYEDVFHDISAVVIEYF
jgi:hypothetical protein